MFLYVLYKIMFYIKKIMFYIKHNYIKHNIIMSYGLGKNKDK